MSLRFFCSEGVSCCEKFRMGKNRLAFGNVLVARVKMTDSCLFVVALALCLELQMPTDMTTVFTERCGVVFSRSWRRWYVAAPGKLSIWMVG